MEPQPETQISAHMIYPAVLKARVLRNIQTPLCLHMVARVYIFVELQDARACVCACVFSRYFTSSFTTTHTPSHQGAKQNNGAGQAIGLAGVSLLSVALCLCSISLSSLFKIINVVHVLKTMEKPTTVGLRRVKLTQKWHHEKLTTMWIRKTKTKKHTDYMFLFSPCNIQYRLFFLVIEQILVKFPVSCPQSALFLFFLCFLFLRFFPFHSVFWIWPPSSGVLGKKIPLMYPVIFSDTLRHTDTQILHSPHQPSGGAPGYSSHTHTCKHTPM